MLTTKNKSRNEIKVIYITSNYSSGLFFNVNPISLMVQSYKTQKLPKST